MRLVTGERVTTSEGGFNATYQRHAATYALAAPLLRDAARLLDLGCGIGHSAAEVPGSIGLDLSHTALAGQSRPTVVADMRQLPFAPGSFDAVLSVQSLEHVPAPADVVGAVRAALGPTGIAVFVTPNRLTFGAPDEVIDPYHFVEYDPEELRLLCQAQFAEVTVQGLFGSPRYLELLADEHAQLHRLLRFDPLRLRRLVPRRLRQRLYDRILSRRRKEVDPRSEAIQPSDFHLGDDGVDEALDLVAICRPAAAATS